MDKPVQELEGINSRLLMKQLYAFQYVTNRTVKEYETKLSLSEMDIAHLKHKAIEYAEKTIINQEP